MFKFSNNLFKNSTYLEYGDVLNVDVDPSGNYELSNQMNWFKLKCTLLKQAHSSENE